MFLIIFLMVLSVCIAGCSSKPEEPAATPSPQATLVSTDNPAELALQSSELPEGYVISNRSERNASWVSQSLRDLGWIKGYSTKIQKNGSPSADVTVITQEVSIFPREQRNNVISFMGTSIMSQVSYKAEELSDPKIGDSSMAYTSIDPKWNMKVYTIIFMKGGVNEIFVMWGTTPDYETLKSLANVAAAKIH